MENSMNLPDVLENVKMTLILDPKMVFYSSLICSLDIRLSDEVPTAATNGKFILFNPEFLNSLSKPERTFLMLHELRHVCYEHMFRIGNRDLGKWNMANDHVINLELIDEGHSMPKGGLADPQYKGMSSEEVYELLPDPPEDFEPDLQKPEDASPDEIQKMREDIKDMIIQAVQHAEMRNQEGSIPQNIKRQVEEWLNPVLPWQTILQKYMTAKCKDDYSWARRNRRFQDIYLPSLYSDQVGAIHFFIDGSCSVSDEDFALQVNQIMWIKKNINPSEIRIIVFNTAIVDEFIFTDEESINVEFHARGGTSVTEIIQYMEEHKAEANIVFTDGYFNAVDASKVKNLIWCIYANPTFEYDYGKILTIPKLN